ncbi:hypothetical protein ACOMHN_026656 [Nucella lapillus]
MKICLLLLFALVFAVLAVDAKLKRKVSKKRAAACKDNQFHCSNGLCIPQMWLCDTQNDCGNNEDEVGCATDCSGANQVHCSNNLCIPLEYRCDGDNNCLDNTDEMGCDQFQCPDGEVKCPGNQRCLISTYLCDGDDDCGDYWDENPQNCPVTTRPH